MKTILVTGGAGFIGSNFVELALKMDFAVVVLDALTYAGHKENLEALNCHFYQGDIRDRKLVSRLLKEHSIQGVLNFAAESHVDRSIEGPEAFVQTNVLGVLNMLQCSQEYWQGLTPSEKQQFRFVQVSTDEVYGTLGETGRFSESTPYAPNSPYSASKAGGDLLARAWFHTYQFPVITTNCSNNYGPKQYPEKLIPHMIQSALGGAPLPVYGKGQNVRDWIHVSDHCRGVMLALEKGVPGETYCFGGNSERQNLDVVRKICAELDHQRPRKDKLSYSEQITFVTDRKGHDWRYAIDDSKAQTQLGFKREFASFEQGLASTIRWYLQHSDWVQKVTGSST